MVFSSAIFLFAFLPAFLLVYFVVPGRAAKNVVLLLASLLFYAWGEPVYVWLMVASIAANWGFGLAIGKTRLGGGRPIRGMTARRLAGAPQAMAGRGRCSCWRSSSTAWS